MKIDEGEQGQRLEEKMPNLNVQPHKCTHSYSRSNSYIQQNSNMDFAKIRRTTMANPASLSHLNVHWQDLCLSCLLPNLTVWKEAYGRTRAEAGKTDTLLTQIRKSIIEMCLFCKDST